LTPVGSGAEVSAESDAGANRLGALALALVDRLHAAVRDEGTVGARGGRSVSASTALSALRTFLDEPSVDLLGAVLGLTSSGTVRLVDGLAAEGLVTRRRGTDARVTVVTLTEAGRQAADAVVASRASVLTEALAPLSAGDRASFDVLVSRVLAGVVRDRVGAREPAVGGWMCRLCDTATCGAERGQPCPVTREALGLGPGPASTAAPQLTGQQKGEGSADEDQSSPRRG
jgi:DNA-binding MarR family transcriptional regulator